MTNKKSEIEFAIDKLKLEGYTSKDIKNALHRIKKDASNATTKSLDELLDGITEDNNHDEQITDVQGKEII